MRERTPVKFAISETLGAGERDAWERFWTTSRHSHPRQHHAFAEVEAAKGRRPLFARAEEGGRPVAIALFSVRPVLPGGRLSAEAVCVRGPVFDDPAAGRALIDAVASEMRDALAGSIRLSPYWLYPEADDVAAMLRDAGFSPSADTPRDASGLVDLARGEDEMLASFSTSTRKEIRLAERRGVEVRPLVRGPETDAAFACLLTHRRDRGLPPVPRREFDGMFDQVLSGGDLGVLLGATHAGRLLGVISVIASVSTAHPAHYSIDAAACRDLSNLSIGPALWWSALRWARDRGCAHLDVEGNVVPLDPSHRRYEYENFKRRFAPRAVDRLGEHVLVCNAAADSLHRGAAGLARLRRRAALGWREMLTREPHGTSRTRPVVRDPRDAGQRP